MLVPVAVDQAYSYAVGDLDLAVGDIVEVALGPRPTIGVVWGFGTATRKLKPVAARLDVPPLPDKLREFVDWVARWTLSPRGMVLRMCLRAPFASEPAAPRFGLLATDVVPEKLTPAREKVLAAARKNPLLGKGALAEAAGCTTGVVNALLAAGALELAPIPGEPPVAPLAWDHAIPRLSEPQARAADQLAADVAKRRFGVILLEGVTGSGKTEVYMEAVAEALRAGRQALVLLPEIALTTQFLARFAARFGALPAEWHSAVPARRRALVWHAVATGEAKVVVGARSALFLPFKDLAVIVVDEEHEAAYKQEDGVTYHARDMAVVRGRIEEAAVVLASATPSLETQVNARQGRYSHLVLPGRYGARPLPALAALDLRRDPPPRGRFVAPPLEQAIRDTVSKGEQALLFLNRRGYAPLTLCRTCGHRFQCPNCAAWLVEHRFRHALMCHHCGHQERRPECCPVCEGTQLVPCGPGIERLAEEAAERFPDARILTLSSDILGGPDRLRDELDAVADGRCDIVIGTQLVAKGHNFPLLTLVGVIDADVGLSTGDPRAAERTFQLLQQVTGRAGRFEKPGRAILQTWQPDHPVIRALVSGEGERFYAEETRGPRTRRPAAVRPPRGDHRLGARSSRRAGARARPGDGGVQDAAVGPLEPRRRRRPAARGRNDFARPRRGADRDPVAAPLRLLVKAPRSARISRALAEAAPPPRGGVKVAYDVDPQSFL